MSVDFPFLFEQRIKKDFPNSANNILDNLRKKKKCETFRLNPQKCTSQDIESLIPDPSLESIPWDQTVFSTENKKLYSKNPLIFGGLYYFQSLSSTLPVQILDPLPSDIVLDACASPGSKSTQILSRLEDGFLVANEIDRTRLGRLVQNISEWGTKNIWVTQKDTRAFIPLEGIFDKVLVDAPCSGEGTFYKDPQALEAWSPKKVSQYAKLQKQILGNLLPTLKQGGELVYSTCTLSVEENEEIVDWLLEQNQEYIELVSFSELWDGGETGVSLPFSSRSEEISKKTRRIFPYHQNFVGEAFFLAKFRILRPVKRDERQHLQKHKYQEILSVPEKMLRSFWKDMNWKGTMDKNLLLTLGHSLYMHPGWNKTLVRLILETLHPIYAGCRLGTIKDKWILPTYEWVLQRELLSKEDLLDLDDEQIRLYCLGVPQAIPNTVRTGFVAISYKNVPLGIGKILKEGVLKSYFSPVAGKKVFV